VTAGDILLSGNINGTCIEQPPAFCANKELHCQIQQKSDKKIVQKTVAKSQLFHLFIFVLML
jgi:hypothetical protein